MGCCSSTEGDAETDISYADWVEEHAETDALNADWTEELPSTEDAKTDIAYAKWTDELPCPCSRQHSFTTGLIWEKVPVEPISCCPCSCTLFTCGVEKEMTHQAVQATFKCDSCGHQFRRTYEVLYHEEKKHKRWGYYGNRFDVLGHSADRFSFEHLEQCYEQIEQQILKPYRTDNVDENWAYAFYELVTAGEPNRSHRM